MLQKGGRQWNNELESKQLQPPEQPVLQTIAEAALRSSLELKGIKRKPIVVDTSVLSVKPHPYFGDTTILSFSAQLDENGLSSPNNVHLSVLMKSTPVELQAYSSLFKDLQSDADAYIYGGQQQQRSLSSVIPRCYLVQRPYIYLENLETLLPGTVAFQRAQTFGRQDERTLDFSHCLLAVETLARFHASSYILRRQLGAKGKGKLEMLQKYPFLSQQSSQYSPRLSSQLAPIFEQAFDLAIRVLQKDDPSFAFKLQRKVLNPGGIYDKVVKLLEEEKYDNDDFYVVCHGNFLSDNLLFSYENSGSPGEPTQCRIVNFNSIFFGPLASDLALFLLTSTTLEFRMEFEEKLLAFYCDAFQEQLVAKYGRNSPTVEEFEENIDEFHRKVEKQYKKMMEFAFYNACVLLPIILRSGTDMTDGADNNNDISATIAIKDLLTDRSNNCLDNAVFERLALNNPIYNSRLGEIVKQLSKNRVLL